MHAGEVVRYVRFAHVPGTAAISWCSTVERVRGLVRGVTGTVFCCGSWRATELLLVVAVLVFCCARTTGFFSRFFPAD